MIYSRRQILQEWKLCLSAAAPNSFIDITWTANAEPDLAGYNVYRHTWK